MEGWLIVAVVVAVVLFQAGRYVERRRKPEVSEPAAASTDPLYAIAGSLDLFFMGMAQAEDLRSQAAFDQGVALLCGPDYDARRLAEYWRGDNHVISCMAAEALSKRPDGADERQRILQAIGNAQPWPMHFALDYLAAATPPDEPLVWPLLVHLREAFYWQTVPSSLSALLSGRIAGGEAIDGAEALADLRSDEVTEVRSLVSKLEPDICEPLNEGLKAWQAGRVDTTLLASVGSVWKPEDGQRALGVVPYAEFDDAVDTLAERLTSEPARSQLLVGESGVGKTTLVRALADRLGEDGWLIFVAGYNELVAGQMWYGQFEERMRALIETLRGGRKVLWFVPDFDALVFAGRHQNSRVSALDTLLPHVQVGDIAMIGELTPPAYDRLAQSQPAVSAALTAHRVAPLDAAAAKTIAREWVEAWCDASDAPGLVDEAWELARQYASEAVPPGNLMSLLTLARQRLVAAGAGERPRLDIDVLIETLAERSGLPLGLLDQRRHLDLESLRGLLEQRVLGQAEAVDCLVERVAMIKAGVADPTRPSGVFLFAGPTGTGKTELAKSLAEWLFGSPERMIRLDMSEFQTADSLVRIFGAGEDGESDSFIDQVRRQPFAVILLDEFEKAHERIWSLFLQVFDDGRMTDARGVTTDFRHCIIILTSNLGAKIDSGLGPGFRPSAGGFDAQMVMRAVTDTFAKEFVNRLDRVVVFNPLDRELMRGILERELRDVLQRRGLRSRSWAVEWDDAALDFLLDRGFTPDLGARPLRRAIERHFLAPLALAIVDRTTPEGDQFLFVGVDGDSLDVRFVDPDAPDVMPAPAAVPEAEPAWTPASILAEPNGSAGQFAVLRERHKALLEHVEDALWQGRKEAYYTGMSAPEFWHDSGRHQILDTVEYMDRVEQGVRRGGSLIARLEGGRRSRYPADLIRHLAQTLFLLETAREDLETGRPHDAFLLVEGDGSDFARRLAAMYRGWARARRMRCDVLDEADGKDGFRLLLAVGGYGAHSLLASETGIHVFERPREGSNKGFERDHAHVRVLAQPVDEAPEGSEQRRAQAKACLEAEGGRELSVVRRYREQPSPLVRDARDGWRTGRLEHVLAGNFDLYGLYSATTPQAPS